METARTQTNKLKKSKRWRYNVIYVIAAKFRFSIYEGTTMIISYDNLWKTLIDKKMNKTELAKKAKISSSTIAKMTRGEPVAMTVLVKICDTLNCDVGDILSIRREES